MVSGGGITVISTIGDVYVADYVICAVPLGLLQSGFIQFDPPLSKAKLNAINGYGVLLQAVGWSFLWMFS